MAMTPKQMLARAAQRRTETEQPAEGEKDEQDKPAEDPKKNEPVQEPTKEPQAADDKDDEAEGDEVVEGTKAGWNRIVAQVNARRARY